MRWIFVHHLLILLQASQQQNILIIMQTTPKKTSTNANNTASTLKNAINRQVTHKQLREEEKGSKELVRLPEDELQLLENIQAHEAVAAQGYMKYEDWMSFNANQFPHVPAATATNLWKIVRIINYGEVAIPTGLIYELSYYFVAKNKIAKPQNNSSSLKGILDTFLSINRKKDSVSTFRELANYPSLQSIEKQYCPVFYASHSRVQMKSEAKPSSLKNGGVFDRLHKQGRTRDNSIQKMKYASMAKELKECKFTPSISNYQSKTDAKRCDRICKHNHVKICPQQQLPYQFSAMKLDQSIFKGSINDIPGAMQHVQRAQASEAQRQRIQRYLSKPWLKVR